VMPMEKSYMDIQAAAAADLPLQVSNFWWVWVKRWIILLCDECAMLVCVVVLFVCTKCCVCVCEVLFLFCFFFLGKSSIKETVHFALSCISFQ
jgi:hypothetical protein